MGRSIETERNMLPATGATFFRDGDTVMFQFVIDPGNVLGPRPATRLDQEKHPGAWSAFTVADGVSPLDRDASGGDGGSLPGGETSPAAAVEDDGPGPDNGPADRQPAVMAFEADMLAEQEKAEAAATRPTPAPKRKYTRRKKG